jgi:hypothetical protein
MAKAPKKSTNLTLPLAAPSPPRMPQIGDRVIPERSDSVWKITSVRSESSVDLELPGTYLTRFRQDVSTLKFVDEPVSKAPEPSRDMTAISERIANIQRENLQRLDDDIAILTKYLKTEGASEHVIKVLDQLGNEQHASWQAAAERIEELMEEE